MNKSQTFIFAALFVVCVPTFSTDSTSHVITFLKDGDTKIWIGDCGGGIEDVQRQENKTRCIGDRKKWKFKLSTIPTEATLNIQIFSLAHGTFNCRTFARINKGKKYDLRKGGSEYGTGIQTKFTTSVESREFKVGENKLVIEEDFCYGSRALNDSLIVEATLTLVK